MAKSQASSISLVPLLLLFPPFVGSFPSLAHALDLSRSLDTVDCGPVAGTFDSVERSDGRTRYLVGLAQVFPVQKHRLPEV